MELSSGRHLQVLSRAGAVLERSVRTEAKERELTELLELARAAAQVTDETFTTVHGLCSQQILFEVKHPSAVSECLVLDWLSSFSAASSAYNEQSNRIPFEDASSLQLAQADLSPKERTSAPHRENSDVAHSRTAAVATAATMMLVQSSFLSCLSHTQSAISEKAYRLCHRLRVAHGSTTALQSSLRAVKTAYTRHQCMAEVASTLETTTACHLCRVVMCASCVDEAARSFWGCLEDVYTEALCSQGTAAAANHYQPVQQQRQKMLAVLRKRREQEKRARVWRHICREKWKAVYVCGGNSALPKISLESAKTSL